MGRSEPQLASDYDRRTTEAVKSALVEIGQILGGFQGKFVVVGGSVPWLLLNDADMPHVGTTDIDLSLDAEALGEGDYANLIDSLMGNGFRKDESTEAFQLVRTIELPDGGPAIEVIVDFLMPKEAKVVKNRPPIIEDFRVIRADGADLAIQFNQILEIEGQMPTGGTNKVRVAVASIPAFLAMKGFAINNRLKNKDAYDIYYCIKYFDGGIVALAEACKPILETEEGKVGYGYIAEKFESFESFGPTCVRNFESSNELDEESLDLVQRDAFGQVNALLRELGLT